MQQIPLMSAVMTPFPHSIPIDATLEAAAHSMRERKVRHLPVKDGQALVGVISEREIAAVLAAAPGPSAVGDLQVRAACRPEPYEVDVHERLDDVLLEMAERQIDCALVVKSGRLAGIFTTTDACTGFAALMRRLFPPSGTSAA